MIICWAIASASNCDVPLVDRQLEFLVANGKQDSVALYMDTDEYYEYPSMLPSSRADLLIYASLAPGETLWVALPTRTQDHFADFPDETLRIWVFGARELREVPYDSLRGDTSLFDLLTFTEEEFDAIGDTLVID